MEPGRVMTRALCSTDPGRPPGQGLGSRTAAETLTFPGRFAPWTEPVARGSCQAG